MKPLVRIVPFVVGGTCRVEVGLFLAYASAWQAANPDKILDLQLVPERQTPAPVARNAAARKALEAGVSVVFFIDDDMHVPFNFFEAALAFLARHDGPAAIGVPYCTAPPVEDATVFEWTSRESGTPDGACKLDRIRREDAARREGVERVANLGTGCVAYLTGCFKKVAPPWFDYGYNEDRTQVLETEDCHFHTKLAHVGVPLFCHWGCWAGHWKSKLVCKPGSIAQADINELFVKEAEANLRYGKKAEAAPPPARPAFRDQLDAPPRPLHPAGAEAGRFDRAPLEMPPARIFTEGGNGKP